VQAANLNILRVGDIITAVGDNKVASLAALNARIAKYQENWINVHAIRNGKVIQIRLQPQTFAKYKIRQVYSAPVFK
jgi:S1-C subfamily serine protease